MGLTTSITNAVSGLRTNQDALDILSRNIANSGTPGYHDGAVGQDPGATGYNNSHTDCQSG